MRVCIYVDISFTNARMYVSVNLIDSLSITGLEYGITFLVIQILADFEIIYLSLPEGYDLKCFKCSYFSTFTDDKIGTQCLNFSCPTDYV